jgi:hypothetical protein
MREPLALAAVGISTVVILIVGSIPTARVAADRWREVHPHGGAVLEGIIYGLLVGCVQIGVIGTHVWVLAVLAGTALGILWAALRIRAIRRNSP